MDQKQVSGTKRRTEGRERRKNEDVLSTCSNSHDARDHYVLQMWTNKTVFKLKKADINEFRKYSELNERENKMSKCVCDETKAFFK